MPWQRYVSDRSLEVDKSGRLLNDVVVVLAARQQGKTAWLAVRILWELYVRGTRLSIHTAQDRALAREVFSKVAEMIERNPWLSAELDYIRLANGQEEIKLLSGSRYKILAPTTSAARGLSVDGVNIVDEARELETWDVWASLSKTTIATDNPQTIVTSNAGHAGSLVLNDLRDKGRAAAADPKLNPSLCYLEWSADPSLELGDVNGWAQANPALGTTVTLERLESAFRFDPPAVFATEVLCRWVETMTGILPPDAWDVCADPNAHVEPGVPAWLAVDVSPSHDEAVLLMAAEQGERLVVSVVERWYEPRGVDERKIADRILEWAGAYSVWEVGFDRYTASGVAARIEASGYAVRDISGARFYEASQRLFDTVVNGRLVHPGDTYLTAHVEAAARQDLASGAWRISRRDSSQSIVAAVALAQVVLMATDPSQGVQIY